jgi:peptidoglycan/LPS O-acetylase OafA/YrhL
MPAIIDSRYAHIDAMRALAVMLVVVAHAGYGDIVPGGSGVTIFFSISGFIITHLLLNERDRSGGFAIGGFYNRRFMKIFPPLLVCVIIPTLILAIFRPINWSPFFGVLFFYYNWFKIQGMDAPLPGSGVVWSLSIEEQFYLAFAIIWIVIVKSGLRARWLGVIAATAVAWSFGTRIVLASLSPAYTERIYYGSDTRLDGIALGILAAVVLHYSLSHEGRARALVRFCSRDTVLIGAVLLYVASLVIRDAWFRDTFRFSFQSIAACTVILYGFGGGQSRIRNGFNTLARLRLVQFIGLASYSIYLVHMTVAYYAQAYVAHLPNALRYPTLIALGTGVGIIVYVCVEQPVQRMRKRVKANRRKAGIDSPAAVSATSP